MAAAIVSHWNGDYLYESENRYIYQEVAHHSKGMKLTFIQGLTMEQSFML